METNKNKRPKGNARSFADADILAAIEDAVEQGEAVKTDADVLRFATRAWSGKTIKAATERLQQAGKLRHSKARGWSPAKQQPAKRNASKKAPKVTFFPKAPPKPMKPRKRGEAKGKRNRARLPSERTEEARARRGGRGLKTYRFTFSDGFDVIVRAGSDAAAKALVREIRPGERPKRAIVIRQNPTLQVGDKVTATPELISEYIGAPPAWVFETGTVTRVPTASHRGIVHVDFGGVTHRIHELNLRRVSRRNVEMELRKMTAPWAKCRKAKKGYTCYGRDKNDVGVSITVGSKKQALEFVDALAVKQRTALSIARELGKMHRVLRAKRNPGERAVPWAKVRKGSGRWVVYGRDKSGLRVTVETRTKKQARTICDALLAGAQAKGQAKALGKITRVRREREATKRVKQNPQVPLTKKALAPISKVFRELQTRAKRADAKLGKLKLVAKPGVHDTKRHFAYYSRSAIYVAPELALEPESVIRGVLAHEFGHAWRAVTKMSPKRRYDEEERATDKAAEAIFGIEIYYDRRGVETTRRVRGSKRPRPTGLR